MFSSMRFRNEPLTHTKRHDFITLPQARTFNHLRGLLRGLVRVDLLSILVVPDAWRGGTVTTTLS